MKKVYQKPALALEQFTANEYVSACYSRVGTKEQYWIYIDFYNAETNTLNANNFGDGKLQMSQGLNPRANPCTGSQSEQCEPTGWWGEYYNPFTIMRDQHITDLSRVPRVDNVYLSPRQLQPGDSYNQPDIIAGASVYELNGNWWALDGGGGGNHS